MTNFVENVAYARTQKWRECLRISNNLWCRFQSVIQPVPPAARLKAPLNATRLARPPTRLTPSPMSATVCILSCFFSVTPVVRLRLTHCTACRLCMFIVNVKWHEERGVVRSEVFKWASDLEGHMNRTLCMLLLYIVYAIRLIFRIYEACGLFTVT